MNLKESSSGTWKGLKERKGKRKLYSYIIISKTISLFLKLPFSTLQTRLVLSTYFFSAPLPSKPLKKCISHPDHWSSGSPKLRIPFTILSRTNMAMVITPMLLVLISVLVCFSVALIKHWSKTSWGRKRFILFSDSQVSLHHWVMESGQECEAGTETGTMQD